MTAPVTDPTGKRGRLSAARVALSAVVAAAIAAGVLLSPGTATPPPVEPPPVVAGSTYRVAVGPVDTLTVRATTTADRDSTYGQVVGDLLIGIVHVPADTMWWNGPGYVVSATRDDALVWAHMVDSVAALAQPDSTPGHISGIDTLVHVFPPGGPLWHNSALLYYTRGDIHNGHGMQNHLSIGSGPALESGQVPGIYYQRDWPTSGQYIEVPPAAIAQLTAAIRAVLGAPQP